jgi:hypothetical protein
MTSVKGSSPQSGSSGFSLLLAGFILGFLAAIIIPIAFHFSPIYVDCGCGAAIQAAHNCVASGDLNSSWCGWLL